MNILEFKGERLLADMIPAHLDDTGISGAQMIMDR